MEGKKVTGKIADNKKGVENNPIHRERNSYSGQVTGKNNCPASNKDGDSRPKGTSGTGPRAENRSK